MTKQESLLTLLGEECNEIAQRVSKALRFGLDEKQEGQSFTNRQRLCLEMVDYLAVVEILAEEGIIPEELQDIGFDLDELMDAKIEKVKKYIAYSRELGTLSE